MPLDPEELERAYQASRAQRPPLNPEQLEQTYQASQAQAAPQPPTPHQRTAAEGVQAAMKRHPAWRGDDPSLGRVAQTGLEVVLPALGGAVGAAGGVIVGGAVGGPPGLAVGGVTGAGVGAAGGMGLAKLAEPYTLGQAATSADTKTAMLWAGLFGAGGQAVGLAVSRGFGMWMKKNIHPPPEAQVAQRELEKVGASLTPGQYTGLPALQRAEAVAETTPLGLVRQTPLAAVQATAEAAVPKLVGEFLETFGTAVHPRTISQMVIRSRETTLKLNKIGRKQAWDEVDRLTEGAIVDSGPVSALITKPIHERALTAAGLDPSDLTGSLSFERAQEIKTALGSVARRKPTSLDDQAVVNTAGMLEARMGGSMEQAAANVSPEARRAYQFAREFHKQGIERYENELLRGFIKTLKKTPSNIDDILASSQRVDTLRTLKGAVDPYTYEAVQAAATSRLVRPHPTTGMINGEQLLTVLRDYGDDAGLVFKSPQAVRDLATTAAVVGRKQGEHATGLVFWRIVQASAMGGFLSLAPSPIGVTITTTSTGLNLLLARPALMRRITNAAKTGQPGLLTAAVSQVSRELYDEFNPTPDVEEPRLPGFPTTFPSALPPLAPSQRPALAQ